MFESFLFFNEMSEVLKVKEFLTRRKIEFQRKGLFIFVFDKIGDPRFILDNYNCRIFLQIDSGSNTKSTWREA